MSTSDYVILELAFDQCRRGMYVDKHVVGGTTVVVNCVCIS